jgi:hypothetical protein
MPDQMTVRQRAAAIITGRRVQWLEEAGLTVVEQGRLEALERLEEVAREWRMSLSDIAGPVRMEDGVEALMARADRNVTAFERLRDVIDELEASER